MESRIKELARMGFKKVFVAKDSISSSNNISNMIEICSCKTLNEVIRNVYS